MNSNFDGVNGMYGSVQFGALTELGRLFRTGKGTGVSWKRVAVALAVMATPLALLLTGGLGS